MRGTELEMAIYDYADITIGNMTEINKLLRPNVVKEWTREFLTFNNTINGKYYPFTLGMSLEQYCFYRLELLGRAGKKKKCKVNDDYPDWLGTE